MDPLSKLLMLNVPEGEIDKNCLLSGDWRLPHKAGDLSVIRWHTVTQGGGWLDMPAGKSFSLLPGTILFLPHNSAHRLRSQQSSGTHIVCGSMRLPVSARHFQSALPEVLVFAPVTESAEYHWLQSVLSLLQVNADSSHHGADALCSQLCASILTLAVRDWLLTAPPEAGVLNLLFHPRLSGTILDMLVSPATPWTVERLARTAHMSRASFAHLFRQVSGTTPLAVLTTIRLQIAAQLLSRQVQSIINIADDVGYANESSFHKAFVRHFHCTPGEYRKRVQIIGELKQDRDKF
ncbi:AraC family transcriptional regulator [Shimwellia pseudoproteus]|uniref:reactive chlorine-specific transcriptional regulator RclR n=1 Tax=Shimwellia pseudoproteus TaxID=570012 RepID=UPI0018EA3E00|nr:reactive chlorine-specific transcriptional regulator RclR [Shimwellia pseudoproteus]MBJ3816701.1 AraC family transcriptional regulator [Shimwellia pseudoproteus]